MSVKMSQDNDTLYFTHFNVDVHFFLGENKSLALKILRKFEKSPDIIFLMV